VRRTLWRVKTQDGSLEDDDRAMADLAEVRDWTRVWGPVALGRTAVMDLAKRAEAATGWEPWPITPDTPIHETQPSWGHVTGRGTVMTVYPDAVLPVSPRSGWSAYQIADHEIALAEEGLDFHWPRHVELARRHWGDPVYVGKRGQSHFPDAPGQPAVGYRHIAVWLRPGAEFHLYAEQPAPDSPFRAVAVNYIVYAAEVTP
jgi:hypothetical protein